MTNTTMLLRRRFLCRLALAVAVAVVLALAVSVFRAAAVSCPRRALSHVADPGIWRGAYHVHTRMSPDASGTIAEVAAAARASGDTWVLITDHNQKDPAGARYIDGVLFVFATEVSTAEGHVTAPGVSRALTDAEREHDPLGAIQRLGGAPVAAHPLNRRRPYTRLDDQRLAGLEVLSLDTLFRQALVSPYDLLRIGPSYVVNAEYAALQLLERPDPALGRWDTLLARQRMSGFCALDAHGRPAYRAEMRALAMYAMVGRARTDDAAADGQALVRALVQGRSFCGIDGQADAGGFRFTADTEGGQVAMGDEVALARQPILRIDLGYDRGPSQVHPHLICGGTETALTEVAVPVGRRYAYRPTRAAACRAEVWFEDGAGRAVPWILSNPIYIR